MNGIKTLEINGQRHDICFLQEGSDKGKLFSNPLWSSPSVQMALLILFATCLKV